MSETYTTHTIGTNPILKMDYPDPDVIFVDGTFYMISTTMHYMPGAEILRSYDLINWEHETFVYDKLDSTEGQRLCDDKYIYGKGMWAATIRFHEGMFYVVFVCNDTGKTYLYRAESIDGPWAKSEIEGFYHDCSLLFDDGKAYLVYGNTEVYLTELNEDMTGPKEGGLHRLIVSDKGNPNLGYEGSHLYKINGKYYLFFIHSLWDKWRRVEACFVADSLEGEFVGGDIFDDDMGFRNSGIAQGGIVEGPEGVWNAVLFQDSGAVGRIPVLVPVKFVDDFPVFGAAGFAPKQINVPDLRPDYQYKPLYSNDFTNPAWQWNHIPNKALIELKSDIFTVKTDKVCKNVVQAANTLTQRTFTKHCAGSIEIDASNINEGDITGLCALEGEYGFIGITKKNGKYKLITAEHKIPYSPWSMGVFDDEEPVITAERELSSPKLKLKATFNLEHTKENVQFAFADISDEKETFEDFGGPVKLRYTLDQFVGVRFALFCYSTEKAGGKAVFKEFKLELL